MPAITIQSLELTDEQKEILADISEYFISSVASKSADKKTLAEACRSVLEGSVFNRKIFVPFYGLRPREE